MMAPDDSTEADYERLWTEFWKPLVTDDDGNLDLDQVKRELADCHLYMNSLTTVYMEITDGLISKPNTDPNAVLRLFTDNYAPTRDCVVIDREDIPEGLVERLYRLRTRTFVEDDGREVARTAARLLGGDQ